MNKPRDKKQGGAAGPPVKRGCLWWTGRVALSFFVLLVVANLAGYVYQVVASRNDLARYPAPGEYVEVNGTRMHLYCMGEGSPTVILESGAGSSCIDWSLVQPEVARYARVCSYDRPGFGWSEAVRGSLTREQVAAQLHDLLQAAEIPGPYVLVGHSLGGEYVRTFARDYPEETAGLVLVDSSHESESARLPAEFLQWQQMTMRAMSVCRTVSPFGWFRMIRFWDNVYGSSMSALPPASREAMLAMNYQTAYCGAAYNESKMSYEVHPGDAQGPASLGDLPLIVLMASMDAASTYDDIPAGVTFGITREAFIESYDIMQALRQELAGLSSRGKQVIVPESGHYIHWDQPELVLDAIQEVWEAALHASAAGISSTGR